MQLRASLGMATGGRTQASNARPPAALVSLVDWESVSPMEHKPDVIHGTQAQCHLWDRGLVSPVWQARLHTRGCGPVSPVDQEWPVARGTPRVLRGHDPVSPAGQTCPAARRTPRATPAARPPPTPGRRSRGPGGPVAAPGDGPTPGSSRPGPCLRRGGPGRVGSAVRWGAPGGGCPGDAERGGWWGSRAGGEPRHRINHRPPRPARAD